MYRLIFYIIAAVRLVEADTGCVLVEPSNPDICGLHGHFRARGYDIPLLDQPQKVDSITECANLCERRVFSQKHDQYHGFDFGYGDGSNWCQSFEFDTHTNFCQLSNHRVEKAVKSNPKSPYVYYDRNCYDCGRFCDQPFGENLLDNGGFEGELFGPWQVAAGRFAKGFNSKRSFLCTTGRYCSLAQVFNMCNSTLYVFQFDYKIAMVQGTNTATLSASLGSDVDDNIFTYSNTIDSPQPWTRVTGIHRTLGEHQGVRFQFSGSRPHYFIDNVRAIHVPEPSFAKGTESLIINGGFESGDIEPWFVSSSGEPGDFVVVSPGIKSKFALRFRATVEYDFSPFISQNLATKANTTYVLSFDVETKTLLFDVFVSLNAINSTTQQTQTIQVSGKRSITTYFFATDTSSMLSVLCDPLHNSETEVGVVTIDNFKLLEAEPSQFY